MASSGSRATEDCFDPLSVLARSTFGGLASEAWRRTTFGQTCSAPLSAEPTHA